MKSITLKKQLVFLLFISHFSLFTLHAQNIAINNTGAPANPAALLDLSSTTGGFLPPRMTTTQMNAINSPAMGLQVFDSTTHCLMMFTGAFWQTVSCTCATLPPAPGTITQSPAGPLCQGQTFVTYSIAPVVNASSYNWTFPPGFIIEYEIYGTWDLYVSLTPNAVSGNVSVTATNSLGPCTGPSSPPLAITVNPTPAAPGIISGTDSLCPNSTGNVYSIAAVPGTTSYRWNVPSDLGTIVSGQGTTSITVTAASSGASDNITVTATNSAGPCTSPSSPPLLVAVPPAPLNISGNTNPCLGSTGLTYSVAAVADVSYYTWSVPAGCTITSGQGTTSIKVNLGRASGNITVAANEPCGTSTSQSDYINIDTTAVASFTSSSPSLTNLGIVFLPTTIGAASYSWSFQSGTPLTSTAQNPSVTWSVAGTYTVSLTVTSGSGCSSTTTNSITVNNISCPHGTLTFGYTGSIQSFSVPCSATSVTIQALGAQGGISQNYNGGLGAGMKGTFTVTSGETLKILVGQQAGSAQYGAGGGGGSFVTDNSNNPLIIAGGGSGGAAGEGLNGSPGLTSTSGGNSNCCSGGSGGSGGGADGGSSGGGGLTGDGSNSGYGNPGQSFTNGGAGGVACSSGNSSAGGFGGGSGGEWCDYGTAGAGGGYSGGAGSDGNVPGGGGSYNGGTSQTNNSGVQSGNGQVIITW